jgi:uncharacterized protein (TIGR01777 family)
MKKTIVIIGGAGFIGTELSKTALSKGYAVTVVDVNKPKLEDPNLSFSMCNAMNDDIDPRLFEGVGAIVNLAGAPISLRWTRQNKKLIYDSRIITTSKIISAISKTEIKPRALISASAVGYYGDTGDKAVDETFPNGSDFLAGICTHWEDEATKAQDLGIRVVLVRTANVLGKGGILSTLTPLFKKWVGGYFGNGEQYMPWVHYRDIINIYMSAIENENMSGPYNTAAGEPVEQKIFMQHISKATGAPVTWMIPVFIARIIIGEFANNLSIGQKVSSEKLKATGFKFEYENLEQALKDTI